MLRFTGKFVTAAAASCAAFALVPDGVVESEASDRLHILRKQLTIYRKTEQEFRKRWERDEAEGFRKLPARAWPAYQPDPEDIDMLLVKLADSQCTDGKDNIVKPNHSHCKEATFNLAIYGLYMAAATFVWFSFVAYTFTSDIFRAKFGNMYFYIEKALGVILILIALRVALSELSI